MANKVYRRPTGSARFAVRASDTLTVVQERKKNQGEVRIPQTHQYRPG